MAENNQTLFRMNAAKGNEHTDPMCSFFTGKGHEEEPQKHYSRTRYLWYSKGKQSAQDEPRYTVLRLCVYKDTQWQKLDFNERFAEEFPPCTFQESSTFGRRLAGCRRAAS